MCHVATKHGNVQLCQCSGNRHDQPRPPYSNTLSIPPVFAFFT